MNPPAKPAAILDVDGTLVDTNYHHAVAWYRAFRALGVVAPLVGIHRHIGMGSDQLVPHWPARRSTATHGDAVRDAEKEQYTSLISEVEPLEGARDLLETLRDHGHRVVLASSAKADELDHYLDLLDARELADAWTTLGRRRAHQAPSRPRRRRLEKAGGGDAVMIGDSTWDCRGGATRRHAVDRRADRRLLRGRAALRRRDPRVGRSAGADRASGGVPAAS